MHPSVPASVAVRANAVVAMKKYLLHLSSYLLRGYESQASLLKRDDTTRLQQRQFFRYISQDNLFVTEEKAYSQATR